MKIDQIPFETYLSALIEHWNLKMSQGICTQSKFLHGRIRDHVGDHFKSDSDKDADELTYHVVIQACKFVILAGISMLGDDGNGLAERETGRGVVNSKPKMKRVLDRDKI